MNSHSAKWDFPPTPMQDNNNINNNNNNSNNNIKKYILHDFIYRKS